MNLGPNAAFIWASYAATALVLGALVVWLLVDGLRQQRLLDGLEARGIRRRSAQPEKSASAPESNSRE